jgi:hypothetical protein
MSADDAIGTGVSRGIAADCKASGDFDSVACDWSESITAAGCVLATFGASATVFRTGRRFAEDGVAGPSLVLA